MNDEEILNRGGTEEDIKEYAQNNGADLTREDVPKPDPFPRPVYYNKLNQYIYDSNDVPILDLLIDNDEMGQFIRDAINNA